MLPQAGRTSHLRPPLRPSSKPYLHYHARQHTQQHTPHYHVHTSTSTGLRHNRLIVALTGATGAIYGITALQYLRSLGGIETHLIMSKWAHATIKYETPYSVSDVAALATGRTWSVRDLSAPPSSGSWPCDGMLVAPCSMKTLAAIRTGYTGDSLIARAADVCIKESPRRTLVLAVRETPLSVIHLENMLALARMGVVIFPAVPAFYTRPRGLDDVVRHSVARMLDCFGIEVGGLMPPEGRWEGFRS